MFPLRDENPLVRTPIATFALIGLNVFAWVAIQGLGTEVALLTSLCERGLIPGDLLGRVAAGTIVELGPAACVLDGHGARSTLLSHMFLHGGWFHILGNMWFLWVFGDNVEDSMGPVRYVAFYVVCGLAAAAAQIATNPASTIPMVGASGAIGGVMGAYARLYPRAQVHTLVGLGFFFTTFSVPAIFMLGYWFAIQLLSGLPSLAGTGGGVAFWAHIGGFVAGVLLIGPFQRKAYVEAHRAQRKRRVSRHRWEGRRR